MSASFGDSHDLESPGKSARGIPAMVIIFINILLSFSSPFSWWYSFFSSKYFMFQQFFLLGQTIVAKENIASYSLTKISIRTKRSISRVFSLLIVPSPFFVHCPYKGRINRAKAVLTSIYGFCHCFQEWRKKSNFSQAINFLLTGFGRALRRAFGFVFARIDTPAS